MRVLRGRVLRKATDCRRQSFAVPQRVLSSFGDRVLLLVVVAALDFRPPQIPRCFKLQRVQSNHLDGQADGMCIVFAVAEPPSSRVLRMATRLDKPFFVTPLFVDRLD